MCVVHQDEHSPMMPLRPADDFGLRLAVFYGCLFLIPGIQMPFFPLWLKARGLDSEAIGIILATPVVVRIFAVPVINRAIDRAGKIRGGLIAAAFAGAFGFSIVGFSHGFIAIMLAVAFAALVSGPLMSLADAYALKGLNARKRAYGPIRLWGSAMFIGANIGGGMLLAVLVADDLIWLVAAGYLLLGASALWLQPLEPKPVAEAERQTATGHLWQSPQFLAIAAAAGLIQASHAMYYGFSAVDWTAKGIGSTTIGALWGLGVAVEIALFAISGRLRLSPIAFMAIGAAGAVVRWIAMAFDPAIAGLALIQCLHGISFGATHLGAIQFIARAAGDKQAAAAQGDFSTILAIAMAAAAAASGLLYNAFGDLGYAVMAAMAALGGLCLIPAAQAAPGH
jgi:MFS transporter, PPP family, 3-phenylpropionic acid transporter